MKIFFDKSDRYFDEFCRRYGPAVYCSTMEEIAPHLRRAAESGIPIDILSIGSVPQESNDLLTFLLLNPIPIKEIIIHIPSPMLNRVFAQNLRAIDCPVIVKHIGVDWLRPDDPCKSC